MLATPTANTKARNRSWIIYGIIAVVLLTI